MDIKNKVLNLYKQKTKKPCYLILPDSGTPNYLDSSIAGPFYLPYEKTIPLDKYGNPMFMFLQLNLEGIHLAPLPNKGIFQVFLTTHFDYPTEYRIQYYPTILEEFQTDFQIPEGIWATKAFKLKLKTGESFLPFCDKILKQAFQEVTGKEYDDIYEEIVDMVNQALPMAKYGGYGDSVQGRDFDYINHEILFTMRSGFDESISIGDGGTLWIEINKQDLENNNIEKAILDWDCY